MGEQAVALVNAVGYKSAGTVEFLVDSKMNFYFLEMNTRLQVEHPITEWITGVDLVEGMIRVAANKPLNLSQDKIGIKGWAMESRVYAEDPYRDFLPSIGRLTTYRPPYGENVRVDEGVYEGGEISIYYDPMICKLITYGNNRNEAIDKMKQALDEYVIRGVNHNIPFLRAVMENKRFLEGRLSTKFIPEEFPQGFSGFVYSEDQTRSLAALAASVKLATIQHNWDITDQMNDNAQIPSSTPLVITIGDQRVDVDVSYDGDSFTVNFADGSKAKTINLDWPVGNSVAKANIEETRDNVVLQVSKTDPLGYKFIYLGTEVKIEVMTPRQKELFSLIPPKKVKEEGNLLKSPMPGAIQSIAVKPGDKVIIGQELVIIEAMKMQNVLRSPKDAIVKKVLVSPKTTVASDEVLIEFES